MHTLLSNARFVVKEQGVIAIRFFLKIGKSRLFGVACNRSTVRLNAVTKPPEGLGVRLVSAGPLFFLSRSLLLIVGFSGIFGCANSHRSVPGERVEFHERVHVVRANHAVEVQAHVACTQGPLEQMVCGRGSREHESLLVIDVPASVVHAALLAVGLQSGAPGRWELQPNGSVQSVSPRGDQVHVLVRWVDAAGEHECALVDWTLTPHVPRAATPYFVFAGSHFVMKKDGTERYAADESGSIIGLVTFGDEVVGLREVVPDKVDIATPPWRARTAVMPSEGSPVTLVLKASANP